MRALNSNAIRNIVLKHSKTKHQQQQQQKKMKKKKTTTTTTTKTTTMKKKDHTSIPESKYRNYTNNNKANVKNGLMKAKQRHIG